MATKIEEGKPITISLVTHSILISNYILANGAYVSNNQGWSGQFVFDPKTETVTQVPNSSWSDIVIGAKSPCNGRSITKEDTLRCASRNPDTWDAFQAQCVR